MTTEPNLPYIDTDDFVRRFSLRAKNLMWLLGAGASASAGVPTAMDMLWEFKQQLFISQRRTTLQAVSDLSNPIIRERLQAHIDSLGRLPFLGSAEEYAELFEEVYPVEADRRSYLDAKIAGSKPSYGHLALATLMYAGAAPLVWTTNFDALIADACAKVYDTTSALTTVNLDAPALAVQVIHDERWPVEVKLHGDFRSRRLKNTPDELRHQDAQLRQTLFDACRRFGLVVVGYSGRDNSIMDTLEQALRLPDAFPNGLFWLHRGDDPPLPRVADLLAQAKQLGMEAGLVHIENFDEALRDLVRINGDLDTEALDSFATERRPWSGAPVPSGRRGWPVVRLNALPVFRVPTICRRVVCGIGATAEVRKAVKTAGVDIIAVRSRAGVLAFGSDSEVRAAFESYDITDFDVHTLNPSRQRYDSTERGLLREALTTAIERNLKMDAMRSRRGDLLAPHEPTDQVWLSLKETVKTLEGTVSGHPELTWREGVGVRLDWADDRLWLLIEPRTVFDGMTAENKSAASDFARERTARRYNRQLDSLLEFWSERLACQGSDLRALTVGDGIDAVFRISHATGFSWRVGA